LDKKRKLIPLEKPKQIGAKTVVPRIYDRIFKQRKKQIKRKSRIAIQTQK
jgi:hypothetical protein